MTERTEPMAGDWPIDVSTQPRSTLPVGQRTQPKEIATLPPITTAIETLTLSRQTGEPRRTSTITWAVTLAHLATIPIVATYAFSWWRAVHLDTFNDSAYLIQLVSSDQQLKVGWGLVLAVVLLVVLAVLLAVAVAAPCIVAYNAWLGQAWTRKGSLVATGIMAFCVFWFVGPTNPFTGWATLGWGWLGVLLSAVSALLLWVPDSKRFFTEWEKFGYREPRTKLDTSNVLYGPLERYR